MTPEAQAATTPKVVQARYTFTFPQSARALDTDPTTITLQPLSMQQDLHGNRLMSEKNGDIYQKVGLAIYAFDGKPLNWAAHETDARLEIMSPKCRELLLMAFMQIHIPKDEERADFLGTLKLEV